MGKVVKSIFGGGEKAQAPAPVPVPVPPPATPMVDESAILRKKKKQLAATATRSGRQSTILSDLGSNETLG